MDFVVIDCETSCGRVMEIAICRVSNNRILESYYYGLINPEVPLSDECKKLTHITDDMLKNEPSFNIIALDILRFCEGATVVAWPYAYILDTLKFEFNKIGVIFNPSTLDLEQEVKKLYPTITSVDNCLVQLKLNKVEEQHNSLALAKAKAYILTSINHV